MLFEASSVYGHFIKKDFIYHSIVVSLLWGQPNILIVGAGRALSTGFARQC